MPTIRVRPETADDATAVYAVNAAAFGRADEAALVARLRAQGAAAVSLVAQVDDAVVGHILFSPVTVTGDGAPWAALALGPMAVLPARQGHGIGSQLVRAGLDACRRRGEDVVFVLGHPGYYPRFGFAPARPFGIDCQYDVPAEVFMLVELAPGAVAGRRGTVQYHPAFDAVT
jgi:putative acetyltransferase